VHDLVARDCPAHRSRSGDHFVGVDGTCQIVIGAALEHRDEVRPMAQRRDHDDRDEASGAKLSSGRPCLVVHKREREVDDRFLAQAGQVVPDLEGEADGVSDPVGGVTLPPEACFTVSVVAVTRTGNAMSMSLSVALLLRALVTENTACQSYCRISSG